jgi:hypothetical protein
MFLNPNYFFKFEFLMYVLLIKSETSSKQLKSILFQKLFWPFTVQINCSSDFKTFANSWPSASYFISFSRSLEQFFLTIVQNNFGNKITFFVLINSAPGFHVEPGDLLLGFFSHLHSWSCSPRLILYLSITTIK